MGIETKQIKPANTGTVHNTLCSYVQAIIDNSMMSMYEGIILTSCCNSHIDLYLLLKYKYPNKFIYLLDLPKKTDNDNTIFYRNQIVAMIKSYECFSGKSFNELILKNMLKLYKPKYTLRTINIGILGSQCCQTISNYFEDHCLNILFDFSCTVTNRDVKVYANNVLLDYTYKLLNQFPCVVMQNAKNRRFYLDKYKYYLSAILYVTVRCCDNNRDEISLIQQSLNVPILKLETDYTDACEIENNNKIHTFTEALKRDIYLSTSL